MPANASIKAYTDSGKLIARYTMGVLFYPQYRKACYADQADQRFNYVYRCDDEAKKFAANGLIFDTEKDALIETFWQRLNRCEEIWIFDNSLPKGQDRILFVQYGIVKEKTDKQGNRIAVNLKADPVKRKFLPL